MKEILNTLSVWILPFIISVILIFGAYKKVPVYETFTKGAKEVKENDMITVRGKGRFKIGKIINNTRKGNLVLEVEKYV